MAIVAFEYASVAVNAATELRALATRVRERHRSQVQAVIETGNDLLRAKKLLGHGEFLPWILAEFSWSKRTAQNYMNVAERFGGKNANVAHLEFDNNSNELEISDTVSLLSLSALEVLSAKSTPVELCENIVARVEAGERPTAVEVKTMVSDAKHALREEHKPSKKKTPSQQAYQKRIAAKDARERKEWAEKDAQRKAAAQALVAFLKDRLGKDYGELKRLVKDVDLGILRELIAA